MDDPAPVRATQAFARLGDERQAVPLVQPAGGDDDLFKRAAGHEFHDHAERPVVHMQAVQRRDVRMVELREAPCFRPEANDESGFLTKFGPQSLNGDAPFQRTVDTGIDVTDAAPAQ
jgi:hypothetical protein